MQRTGIIAVESSSAVETVRLAGETGVGTVRALGTRVWCRRAFHTIEASWTNVCIFTCG